MKYSFNRFVVAALFVALASVPTLAKVHKANITLKSDTRVGEVLVKKGAYKVTFDDEANELSIWQGGKVLAKSAVQLEPRSKAIHGTEHIASLQNNEMKLISVTFRGTDKAMVLKPTPAQATVKN